MVQATADAMLEALDGVSYWTDNDGKICGGAVRR